jgi:hypothetical protein
VLLFAHGIVGRADLPIPATLFGVAAAMVLIVSFVTLAAGWTSPKLDEVSERPWIRLPRAVDVALGAFGVFILVVTVYSCLAGTEISMENFGTDIIFVWFWVGMPILSLFFGDIWRLLSPWRAIGRLVGRAIGGGTEALPYPERLGRWPAVAGILCFAIAELCWVKGTLPGTAGVLVIIYVAVQFVGMGLYGVEAWTRNGDAFGVYFGLFATASPLRRDPDGRLILRRPLSGLVHMPTPPGTIMLVCTVIGSTAFDGLQEGPLYADHAPDVQRFFHDHLGMELGPALQWTFVLSLLLCVGIVLAIYSIGVAAMGGDRSARNRQFVHTLVPIGIVYIVAHYFSYLMYNGQSVWWLASDPLGDGSDIFGTAGGSIHYSVITATEIWYVQVIALVGGHVSALVLAHDRALVVYRSAKAAVRSQICMLALMVGFTSLGLWLLSVSNS